MTTNTKTLRYKWAQKYDKSLPDSGFSPQIQDLHECDADFTLEDFLINASVPFEKKDGVYHVLDFTGERTGEVYKEV